VELLQWPAQLRQKHTAAERWCVGTIDILKIWWVRALYLVSLSRASIPQNSQSEEKMRSTPLDLGAMAESMGTACCDGLATLEMLSKKFRPRWA
jgi:hypothetical protein